MPCAVSQSTTNDAKELRLSHSSDSGIDVSSLLSTPEKVPHKPLTFEEEYATVHLPKPPESLDEVTREYVDQIIATNRGLVTLGLDIPLHDFEKWAAKESSLVQQDGGGYEYDPQLRRLMIKADEGPLHDSIVGYLLEWLYEESREIGVKQQLQITPGQSEF